ncbi:MAG: tetratricopeptide repeat protein [Desulfobaccales bacterium]
MAKISPRRRSLLENPEEVLTLAQGLLEQLKLRWKWLVLGLALVTLVVAAWAIHAGIKGHQERQAAAALAQVRPRLTAEAGPDVAQALERVVRDYPGTRGARQAQLLRADLLYHLKNYSEAAKAYASLLPSGDPAWDALLNESLSYCYEGMGDYKEAAAALKAAQEQLPGPLNSEIDQRLASLLERAGDYQAAALYWKKLLEQPGSPVLVPYLKERLRADEARGKK